MTCDYVYVGHIIGIIFCLISTIISLLLFAMGIIGTFTYSNKDMRDLIS